MVNDRAQLLLFGAVVIGVTIVSTVVLLNGMQYAGTAGSQPETDELDRAERTEAMVTHDLNRLVKTVIETDPSNPEDAIRENITAYGNYTRNMSVSKGATATNVTYNKTRTEGAQVSESGVNLQSQGTGPRTLDDVQYLRDFTVVVNSYISGANGEYIVDVANESGDIWKLKVEQTATGYRVKTETPSNGEVTECAVSTPSVKLHLVNGTGDCDIHGIRDTTGSVEWVDFGGNGNPQGDYTMRYADADDTGLSPASYPVRPAATFRYRSEDLSYNRTIYIDDSVGVP